uniref:Nuclear receptor-binding factor 2 MIT domain-containing protein n=1 Tax=Vombatus ursinus TaxID=29139 RepID=A0A4X2KH29_VOMUR
IEVMDRPLNLAHQQSRKADLSLASGKYEEAILCHQQVTEYLSEAMKARNAPVQVEEKRPGLAIDHGYCEVLHTAEELTGAEEVAGGRN